MCVLPCARSSVGVRALVCVCVNVSLWSCARPRSCADVCALVHERASRLCPFLSFARTRTHACIHVKGAVEQEGFCHMSQQ